MLGMKNKIIPNAIDPNGPAGWIGTEHPFDLPKDEEDNWDIHVWLLKKHKKELIVKGWNDHFDPEIYENCGHDRLIRAFIPIIAKSPDKMIGTLEAGYNIAYKEYIDDIEIMVLKALADQAAIVIRNRNLQDQLIEAKQLELVPDVTHILRSPSAQVTTLLKAIEDELNEKKPDLKNLKKYTTLCKRAALIIELMSRTLTAELATRNKEQQREKEELFSIVNDLCTLLKFYEVNIKPVNKFITPYIIPLTPAEKTRLQIIILNILHNAIKFSPQGGCVEITCLKDNENNNIVSIRDYGPGILEDEQKFIWKRDYSRRVKGWPEGLGMGLCAVKNYIDELNWSCNVLNHKNGAEFKIIIPAGWRK